MKPTKGELNLFPVSITISALNEEHRIKDTIISARKNNPAEIIVIEGGSTDKTADIARQFADRVYSVDQYGLGYKRAYGVEMATQPFVMTLDADQVLEDNALANMIKELEEKGYAGIQAKLLSIQNETYWEQAMGYNCGLTHSKPIDSNIIGTPAIFRREILLKCNFDKSISGSCDDTDLCYRLVSKGYRLGISSAICYQKHRSSFKTTIKKFSWYGEGDLEFGLKHPERMLSIFTHPIRNYIIKKSILAISSGDFRFAPFFIIVGAARHIGFYRALVRRLFGNKLDSRVRYRDNKDF